MNNIPDLKIKISELSEGQARYFSQPDFDEALIGMAQVKSPGSPDKFLPVYDYELMICDFVNKYKTDYETAREFIEFNTLGSCIENNPIIFYAE